MTMELCSPRILSTTISPFTPKFSLKTSNNKSTYIFNIPTFKFPRKRSFPYYLFSSNTTTLQVSAHFGRPTTRRNSLRKKLLNDQQVNQNNLISSSTSSSFENIENLNYDTVKGCVNDVIIESSKESKSKPVGEYALFGKLENWIDQYKKDVDYWGIGSGKIFTVFEDADGNVKKVVIDEDEILKRSQVEDLTELNSKIVYAKSLAKEMESGENVIPRFSTVAKFVISGEESGFVNVIGGIILHPEFIPKSSRVGSIVLCGLVVFWLVKKLFSFQNKEVHYTELEKEMMRRKLKSRKEKEMLEKGSVEVVQEAMEPPMETFIKPKIDKQELMKNIIKAKASKHNLALVDSSSSQTSKLEDFGDKFQEIRKMAREICEIEGREHSQADRNEEEKQAVDGELCDEIKEIKQYSEDDMSFLGNLPNGSFKQGIGSDGTAMTVSLVETKSWGTEFPSKVPSAENEVVQTSGASNVEVSKDWVRTKQDRESTSCVAVKEDVVQSSDPHDAESSISDTNSVRKKPRVIRSVKEAREFLSRKCDKQEFEQPIDKTLQESAAVSNQPSGKFDRNESQTFNVDNKVFGSANFGGTSESTCAPNVHECSTLKDEEHVPINKDDPEYSDKGYGVGDSQISQTCLDHEDTGGSTKTGPYVKMENWMEENFHDIEPIAKKIGIGFRDNFMVAREKVNKQLNTFADITQLGSGEDDGELEWMKDDKLREIVFQVRENELVGQDPFYLMDAEDKLAFFQGLEKKVEEENEKLSHVHEWLHSNIENLDYGADGISLYDPPEKIIPRWKGPPLEKTPEFLDEFLKQREALFAGNTVTPSPVKKDEEKFLQNSTRFPTHENAATSLATNDLKKSQHKDPKHSKTVIEGSDGSVRSGKKSGKEYWQHTKKWSRGFLESYNAETDPEVKSTMKDMGKDLDRWITEEQIQEAADLMTKLPERNKKFMDKKLNKLKREMELFGPQAVVSKYREYAEEKEEDYLWWLDIPHVLCIELYTIQDGEQSIGFYSLEMAADLELEPKPHHVIAFEDAGDCKNLCYIIQAHLEMLGNGQAFVVARPPKDAFREAKVNGFSVTVIRRGELQLNIDQALEEVEEQITEIGSKIYHDKIMGERSVDVSSLMKGVFGFGAKSSKSKRAKNRAKRMLKRPGKK
ncbi:uncharacterized protein LOC116121292 [Pistacia vera]|uniref:uncharacterized protein LOC116121292 n=1 Tax=Pistacia vera TaxID=55513 RepID=UPI0012636153|nr:uncharacterized protein LOC116121292 [Pistacia vera]